MIKRITFTSMKSISQTSIDVEIKSEREDTTKESYLVDLERELLLLEDLPLYLF